MGGRADSVHIAEIGGELDGLGGAGLNRGDPSALGGVFQRRGLVFIGGLGSLAFEDVAIGRHASRGDRCGLTNSRHTHGLHRDFCGGIPPIHTVISVATSNTVKGPLVSLMMAMRGS
jgi:hypothetical protein